MKQISVIAGCVAVGFAGISTASAAVVLPGDPTWANPPSENGNGTGSSAITATAPYDGNGSLELHGDRTRFIGLGNPYSSAGGLFLLNQVASFTFDWSVAVGSTQGTTPGYTPALRFHIWDGAQRSELIWEGAYNGFGAGNLPVQGSWYSTDSADFFWKYDNTAGAGVAIYNRTITDWQSIYSPNAKVVGISVGVGSSAGAGYHAFADDIEIVLANGTTTYNFEATAVPEPSTYLAGALMLLPFGLGAVRRMRASRKA